MTDASAMNNSLDVMALGASPSPTVGKNGKSGGGANSWFEAVAEAWGSTLDAQANKLNQMSSQIGGGNEEPSQIAQLSAESMRMSFMAQSENTSIGALGQSLETMARKQ